MYSGVDFLTGSSGQVNSISISYTTPSSSWVDQSHQGSSVGNWYHKDYYGNWQDNYTIKHFIVIEWLRQNMDRFLSTFKHLDSSNPWTSKLGKVIHDILYTGKYDHLEFGQLLETFYQ